MKQKMVKLTDIANKLDRMGLSHIADKIDRKIAVMKNQWTEEDENKTKAYWEQIKKEYPEQYEQLKRESDERAAEQQTQNDEVIKQYEEEHPEPNLTPSEQDIYSKQIAEQRNLLQYESNPKIRNKLEVNIQQLMKTRKENGLD